MSESEENVNHSEDVSPIKEILVMAGILLVYYGIVAGCQVLELHPDFNHIAAVWLLMSSVIWLRNHRSQFAFSHFGKRRLLGLGGMVILAIACIATALSPRMESVDAKPWQVSSLVLIFFIPIAEEVFFRGLLLSHLMRSRGKVLAVILVSLLFGFLHYTQGTMVVMAVLSVLLCIVTIQSKSILPAISVHIAWNALAVIFRTTGKLPRISLALSVVTVLAVAYIALTRKQTGEAINEGAPSA